MHRIEVINTIIEKKGKSLTYIEIGVRNGKCFFFIDARRRIAIDPLFVIERRTYWNAYKTRPWQWLHDSFFPVTSDEFFKNKRALLQKARPGVVFIDGLHTYDQSLKDAVNALEFIDTGGIIIMHDCNPTSEAVAHPAESYEAAKNMNLPNWRNVWAGDVWKTIVHLQTMAGLEVFVLDTDFGLGIIRKSAGTRARLGLSHEQIKQLSYADLEINRVEYLNLKPKEFFIDFVKTVTHGN